MSRRRREFGQQLRFSTIRCRCGGQRLLGQTCTDCGMRPRDAEVDVEVKRRKRIVQQVRTAERMLAADGDAQFDELLDRTSTIIDQFLRPLAILSRPEGCDAIDDLLAAAQALEQLVLDAAVPRLRPYRRIGLVLSDVCDLVRDSLVGFLDALGADTLLLAQELGKAAQQHLDAATARLPALDRARSDLDQLMSSDDDGFLDLLARRIAESNTEGILEADRLGHEVVQRIIGPTEKPAEGSGLGVLWASTFAQVLLDYDRFCSLASTLYRLLAVPGPFDALVIDAEWRGRHQRALTAVVDSSDTLHNMLAVAQHDRAAVRSVLLFVQDVYEGACKHFAATILAQLGTRTYAESMAERRTAPLVHHVRDNAMTCSLAEGLLGPLRNASGHNDYDVRDGSVVLEPGPTETVMTDVQFTDAALLFTESAMALSLAFEIALVQRGASTQPENGQSLLSPDRVVRLLMASSGLSDVFVEMTSEAAVIAGNGTVRSPMTLIGAVLPALPETVTTLSIGWQEGGRTRVLRVPLDLARAHSRLPADTLEQELSHIELCSTTTLDGDPYLTRAGFRHLVALKAGSAVSLTPQDFGNMFRALRQLSTRVGDHHCAEVLRLVTRVQRLAAQDEVAEPAALQAVDELLQWEQQRIARPFAD